MEKIRVMIVEDQELTRLGFRTMIEKNEDLDVIAEAEDGKSAIDIAREMKPDVVVMDIGLPLMNGIDAGKVILEECPKSKMLMLTSHKESKLVFAALSSGAKGYCLKDVSLKRLIVAIRAVANGDVWIDPEIAAVLFASLNQEANSGLPTNNVSNSAGSYTINKSVSSPLSEREMEVLQLLVQGYKNSDIADLLCITIDTVKSHMSHIMNKLAVSDRTQAALEAVKRGIVQLH